MRIRNLLFAGLLWIVCLPVRAQVKPVAVKSACASCHKAQTVSQPQTPMGRALMLPNVNPTLKANPNLKLRRGAYTYIVETHGDNSTYNVTDGVRTISAPIHWNFGAGVQAWLLERNGKVYESLVSYYPEIGGLDLTVGDEGLTPHTLDEAFGRELTESVLKECFGCHATGALANDKLNLESLKPGVTCEHCHAGANSHLLDAVRGDFDSTPPQLGKLSSENLSNFCGQCHRSWETVVRNHWRGEANVRFAPYRLANSKCFDGTDSRISCLACHDPHQDVVRQASWYDSKCLACHNSSAKPASSTVTHETDSAAAKVCPVAKGDCVSCHMPKVKLPDEHVTFTDHQIRIVKVGEPYPN